MRPGGPVLRLWGDLVAGEGGLVFFAFETGEEFLSASVFGFELLVKGFDSLELLVDFGIGELGLDQWRGHVDRPNACTGGSGSG